MRHPPLLALLCGSAAAAPGPVDWTARRAALVAHLFGTNGSVPTRSAPDAAVSEPGSKTGGCLCAARGRCQPADCEWYNNRTRITWALEQRVNDTFTIRLNATVFHTLNTTGQAPIPGEYAADFPRPPQYPQRRGGTVVLFHQGHNTPHDYCSADNHGEIDWLNQLGYDVMELEMPLLGCNNPMPGHPRDHEWFRQFDGRAPWPRFFLEPVVLTINYATQVLGYERVVMVGLSGGGWTTTVAAAIDPRIQLSLPVAGSIPCEFEHTSWDFEQYGACGAKGAQRWPADYTDMYVLAALEPARYSFQVIHEQDPCCFHAAGRHDRIIAYNGVVQGQAQGHFETTPTVGNAHEVNLRDKTIIAMMLDKLRRNGRLVAADWDRIPFNVLRGY